MIRGIGVDIVELDRFQRTLDNWGDVFLNKIFTDKELSYSQSKKYQAQHFAARFAVKEAVAKALAKGWSGGFRWKDIEVENAASGKPDVRLYGQLDKQLKNRNVLISISHAENVVIAIAVLEE